jgi:chitin-binding protein
VVSYNVYRASAPSAGPTKIGNSTGTSFVDSTVQAGQTYYYTVTAVNSANIESPEPAEVAVTVPSS